MDRAVFYDDIRNDVFGGILSQNHQANSIFLGTTSANN